MWDWFNGLFQKTEVPEPPKLTEVEQLLFWQWAQEHSDGDRAEILGCSLWIDGDTLYIFVPMVDQ